MKFKIDKVRPDGFYHYMAYNDDGTPVIDKIVKADFGTITKYKTGWSLYTKIGTDNQEAWIAAVKEFHEEQGITGPADVIRSYIQDIRDFISLDDKRFPENKSLLQPGILDALSIIEGAECNDEFIEKLYSMGINDIPTVKSMIRYAWSAERFNIKNDLNKMAYQIVKLGLQTFINPVLDSVENIVVTFFDTINYISNEVARVANKVIRLYNQLKDLKDPEKRKALWKKFIAQMKELAIQYGKQFMEFVYELLCVNVFIELFKTLKNLWNNRHEIWKSIVAKLKALVEFDYKELGSMIINNLAAAILALLPLLGALIGALFAKLCADEKQIEASRKQLANAVGVDDPDKLTEELEKQQKEAKDKIKKYSVVINLADTNERKFSLRKSYEEDEAHTKVTYNNNINRESSGDYAIDALNSLSVNDIINSPEASDSFTQEELDILCKVSMCELPDKTDFEHFPNDAIKYPEQLTIEFGKDLSNAYFTVHLGDRVHLNDEIGYIDGIVVKSNYQFDVIDEGDNFIVGKYWFDSSVFDTSLTPEQLQQNVVSNANEMINSVDQSMFDSLQDAFKEKPNAVLFIINYMLYAQIPSFALDETPGSGYSINEYIEEYYDRVDNMRDEYGYELQRVAGKDVVQPLAEKGMMMTIKRNVDNATAETIQKYLDLYHNTPHNTGMSCRGRIIDYSLFSHYYEYLTGDRFRYDEDNKLVVKLFNTISKFIARRRRLEVNEDNIDSLILDFNELCDVTIRQYWKYPNVNYYEQFEAMFTGDYYKNSNDIIVTTQDDKEALSMYTRIFNYLSTLTNTTTPSTENNISLGENVNVKEVLNSQSNKASSFDKEGFQKVDNLRKIALRFVMLRKIKLNMVDDVINTYLEENQITKETLQNVTLPYGFTTSYEEYYDGEILSSFGIGGVVTTFNRKSYLGPYLEMLKAMTRSEAAELEKIFNEAIDYYNNSEVNPIEVFKPFMQISWPISSLIYRENYKCDFFLFSKEYGTIDTPPKSLEDLDEIERQVAESVTNPKYDNYAMSSNSGFGMDSIQYWLRYCGMATMVHCMMPAYWSTGLIIPSPPVYILMPVIYLPIFVLKGRIEIVFGLGICGIMIMPMILFVNQSTLNGSVIPPINLIVDMLIMVCEQLKNMQVKQVELTLAPMLKMLDDQIADMEAEYADIPYQISEIKRISGTKKIRDKAKLLLGNDISFKAEMNAEEDIATMAKTKVDAKEGGFEVIGNILDSPMFDIDNTFNIEYADAIEVPKEPFVQTTGLVYDYNSYTEETSYSGDGDDYEYGSGYSQSMTVNLYDNSSSMTMTTALVNSVTNPRMKLVLKDVNHYYIRHQYSNPGSRRAVKKSGVSDAPFDSGKCTYAPSTWYNNAGLDLHFYPGPESALYSNTTLGNYGFKLVWHGTVQQALALPKACFRPGDVSTQYYYNQNNKKSAHGCMYTGKDWRSDFVQATIMANTKFVGRDGAYSVCIWRHPAFQEPGLPLV